MKLLIAFLFIAAAVGWVFAIDSESRYQCAKTANEILAVMVYAPQLPVEMWDRGGDMYIRFNGDDNLGFTYPAHCKGLGEN